MPKLSLQPFQATTYPLDTSLVRKITAHFSGYAARRAVLMKEQLLGVGGEFDVSWGHAEAWAPPERLRIGYVCADFRKHPLAYLVQNMFGMHDHSRFDVRCYATTPGDGSPFRDTISRGCGSFYEVQDLEDVELAQRVNRDRIQVLIDLNGFTAGGKLELYAMQASPLQALPGVAYFGSTGSDATDYYISDRVGTPPELACTFGRGGPDCTFAEKIVMMPNSYQPNDYLQSSIESMSRRPQPRSEIQATHQIPDSAFVYVNFNSYQKIEPVLFNAWYCLV